ncbi:unnamed protein product [Trichobilharzia szidati]|nr:unnamed protein product [Trichobilharzia szidati]
MLSDECRVGHDSAEERQIPSFPYVGQNWAGAESVEIGFKKWLDGHKHYDYFRSYCTEGECNSYAQIVWEMTTDIGCSVTKCSNSLYELSIVCNYGPGGNYIERKPYKTNVSENEHKKNKAQSIEEKKSQTKTTSYLSKFNGECTYGT